jgi:hypothetical protein
LRRSSTRRAPATPRGHRSQADQGAGDHRLHRAPARRLLPAPNTPLAGLGWLGCSPPLPAAAARAASALLE